ncbi:MAG: hypothetical protein IJ412_09160 [Oscillospiraceae bacterium]|nr:hypothetical protein [Oscillospiraceae bacterium]
MKNRMDVPRICGIVGGVLFLAIVAYNLYIYIYMLLDAGAAFNPLTVLTIAESTAIGVLALLDRRGRLLEIVAWVQVVHGFITMVAMIYSVVTAAAISSIALTLIFANVIGAAASVLLATLLIIGSCRRGEVRWLRRVCFLPPLVLLAGSVVSFSVVELTLLSLILVLIQAISALLVCIWVSAPVYTMQPE